MPTIELTKRNVDKIPFTTEGQVDYWCTKTKGLGLRVGQSVKTFIVKADVKDDTKPKGYRTVKKTLGRYGDITPEEARRMVEGREVEQNGKKVFTPGAKLEIKSATVADSGASVTLADMLKFYFTEKNRKDGKPYKQITMDGYTRIIERHFETWLTLPLSDIAKLTPETVIQRFNQVKGYAGEYGARNAFTMLAAITSYAIIRHPATISSNPFKVLRTANLMKEIKARTDKLEGNDFKIFAEGIKRFNAITQDCYLFTLYQGLRNEEAASMRWENIDLDNAVLHLEDPKNRTLFYAPLCRQSMAILNRRKEQNPEGYQFVFPSLPRPQCLNKTGHVRMVAAALKEKTGLSITVHGLRRSFITIGRKLKLFEDTDRLTNHIDSTVTGKHYDGTDVEDLREPLQRIANEIERLMVHGVGAKVIEIGTAKQAA